MVRAVTMHDDERNQRIDIACTMLQDITARLLRDEWYRVPDDELTLLTDAVALLHGKWETRYTDGALTINERIVD